MPTFLVIGAARSGTTALHQYLRQHPDVFMPEAKEPNFFAFEGRDLDFCGPAADWVNNSVTRTEDYDRLFAGSAHKARGEASPLYLYVDGTAPRIRARLPEVRMIAVLRDPAEQAYSHFLYAKRNMIEPLDDFEAAIQAADERMRRRWQPLFDYADFPRYAQQLERFYACFSREQIRLFLYEELQHDPLSVLGQIFAFIGVDSSFVPNTSHRPNAGGRPRNTWLQDLVMRPHAVTRLIGAAVPYELRLRLKDKLSDRNLRRDALPAGAKALLRARQRDDTLRLQDLIGRDLAPWLA
jgi:hypothetical protein